MKRIAVWILSLCFYSPAFGSLCAVSIVSHSFQRPTQALLANTIWGSETFRLQTRDLSRIVHPFYSQMQMRQDTLTDDKHTLGTLIQFHRPIAEDERRRASYLALVTVDPGVQNKGLATELFKRATTQEKNDGIEYWYAYIDPTNTPSQKAAEKNGFGLLKRFTTYSFSRFHPKTTSGVNVLPFGDVDDFAEVLKERYAGYFNTDFPFSILPDQYYVLRKHGEIVAGAQVLARSWTIHFSAGWKGWLATQVFPSMPVLGQLYKNELDFIRLGNIFWKDGKEQHLSDLFSHLLAVHNRRLAIVHADEASSLADALRKLPLGFANRFEGTSHTNVLLKPATPGVFDTESVRRQPLFVPLSDQ